MICRVLRFQRGAAIYFTCPWQTWCHKWKDMINSWKKRRCELWEAEKNTKQTPRNKWSRCRFGSLLPSTSWGSVFFCFPSRNSSEFRLSRHHWFTSGGLSQHQQNISNDSHDGMMSDGKGRKQNINIYHHLHFLSWGEIALKCYVSFSSYWDVVWLHWVCSSGIVDVSSTRFGLGFSKIWRG